LDSQVLKQLRGLQDFFSGPLRIIDTCEDMKEEYAAKSRRSPTDQRVSHTLICCMK